MFKKINRHLLLNYPQLWNTRVVWALLAIAIIHLLFFLAGIFYFDSYDLLHSSLSSNVIYSYNVGFAMLVGVLVVIMWLVFYFRNNPFKSFYPLPKSYFFTEFCIIMLVVFSASIFYKSFAAGFWLHVQHSTADVDLLAESRTFNLAYAFIPSEYEKYKSQECCDSIAYCDSLRGLRQEKVDSLKKLGYDTYDNLALADFDTAIERFERRENANTVYSYLNYCHQFYSSSADTLYSKEQIAATIQLWLTTGNRAAVDDVLLRFDKMCMRYKIKNNINIRSYGNKVFTDSAFHVHDFIRDGSEGYYDRDEQISSNLFLDFREVNNTLDNIYQARHPYFDLKFWLFNFYLSLLAAIAIFTFRLTSAKVWLISLVGGGVIIIATSLLAIAIHQEIAVYLILLAILATFYVCYIMFKTTGTKLLAAINLVWFSWSVPFVGFVLLNLLKEIYKPITTYDNHHNAIYTSNPTYDFLTEYEGHLFVGFMLLLFIYVTTILWRSYRSWKAMAEE